MARPGRVGRPRPEKSRTQAGFFGERGALDALAIRAFPGLTAGAGPYSPVKVWVPGCATGEEAYSVAMLLLERLAAAGKPPALKIFATDTDPETLQVGRRGVYPVSALSAVSPKRLQRFFAPCAAHRFQVSAALRQVIVFARHDLFEDPPISNLDLIVYRRLPPPDDAHAPARLALLLHFALKPGGYLLLSSHADLAAPDLFEVLSGRWPLLRKAARHVTWLPDPQRTRALPPRRNGAHRLEARGEDAVLQSVNQELQSLNSELQSANEELEGSNHALEERAEEVERVRGQLRAVLDATADAVLTTDAQNRIITFNRAATCLFDYHPDEIIGRGIDVLLPDADPARNSLRNFVAGMREVSARRRDGFRFPALMSVSETADGELLVSCLRDLSPDRALQQEVLRIATLEQERIGQELHDGVQQELTGLGLLAQSLADDLARTGSAESELANRLAAGVASTNRGVRSLARGLVPVPVDAATLPAALAELAQSTQETFRIDCRFAGSEPVSLPDAAVATHLFRIAQEAVSNAVKHAKPKAIRIRLTRGDDGLRLEVCDDGVGVPPLPVRHAGVGLRLMAHRCSIVGGRFALEPRAGGGTVISCTIPGRSSS